MAARTSQTAQAIPQGRFLTEEKAREMREDIAWTNFGMSLDEFVKARQAKEFNGDCKRDNSVVGLAMMLPEYWED